MRKGKENLEKDFWETMEEIAKKSKKNANISLTLSSCSLIFAISVLVYKVFFK